MLGLRDFLFGVLLPGFLVGGGLAFVWRPWQRSFERSPSRSFAAFFFGVAFFVSYTVLWEAPPHPFGSRILSGSDWLLWTGLLGGMLHLAAQGRIARALASVLVCGATLVGVLRAMLFNPGGWERAEAVTWLAALALLLAAVAFPVSRLGTRRPGASAPLVLITAGTGLALCAGLTGSAKLAQATGILCACAGATMILSWWGPSFRLSAVDTTFLVTLFFGLGLAAFFYSYLTPTMAWLCAAAPLSAWLGDRITSNKVGARATALRFACAALPVAVAVGLAIAGYEPDPYADY